MGCGKLINNAQGTVYAHCFYYFLQCCTDTSQGGQDLCCYVVIQFVYFVTAGDTEIHS